MDLAPEDTVQVIVMESRSRSRGLNVATDVESTAPEIIFRVDIK